MNGRLETVYTAGKYRFSRVLHDSDGDCWCDLWGSLFPKVEKVRDRDTDADGMTDYEEMVLMQNPYVVNPFPRHLTFQEKAEAKLRQEAKREETRRALRARYKDQILEGYQNLLRSRDLKIKALPEKGDVVRNAAMFAQTLKQLSDDEKSGPRGKKPRETMRYDSYAARITKADHLWPGGRFPFHDATGAGPIGGDPLPPIGIWDQGRILDPIPSTYSGRIIYGDTPLTGRCHTTDMAEIIGGSDLDIENQGLAYQATLKFYDDDDDYTEMAAEAAGFVDGEEVPRMLFSNHAYSPGAGWETYGGAFQYIRWLGPRYLAGEDPEFGAYTWRSKRIDSIIYEAQTYLPIFSAGNDANDQRPFDHVDNVEQVIIKNPIPGPYTIVVSHTGTLKRREPDPNNVGSYLLVPGAEQAFSMAISGNLEPNLAPPLLTTGPPVPLSPELEWVNLTVTGFAGVVYQVEASNTLDPDDWTEFVTYQSNQEETVEVILTTTEPTPIMFLQTPTPFRFYRVREVVPPTE